MIFVFIVALCFHVGAIYFSYGYGFNRIISDEVILLSSIDIFLSFIVTYLALGFFLKDRAEISNYYENTYGVFFEKNKASIFIFLLFGAYLAYQSLNLILEGIQRHQLLEEYDTGGFGYMAFSGFFKIFLAFVLYFRSSFFIKTLAISGLVLSVLITASRSELRYVIHFFLVLMIFNHGFSGFKQVFKFILIAILLIVSAIFVTAFIQNRPISEGVGALFDITRTVFQYRSYGYFLAENGLADGDSFDKVLFPFLGYVSEFILKIFGGGEVRIDSDYVGYLHNLGSSPETGRPYLSNVVYPWWSWFVGTYGYFGLIIKALFVFSLIALLISFRLLFTLVLLLSFVLLGTAVSHPLMTLTHVFAFLVAIFVDVVVKIRNSKLS